MIETITSLDDERLNVYARLTEVQLRNKLEPEKGIFIAESDKVIDRALDAGYEPLSLLVPEHKLAAMESLIDRAQAVWERYHAADSDASEVKPSDCGVSGGISKNKDGRPDGELDGDSNKLGLPVYIAPAKEIEKLAGYELTRGVLCAMRRKPLALVREILQGASRVAILEDITNHTNVGAAFRSAAALGIDALLVTPACCDPLYRRAVRVSMGTVFQVPWTRIGMTDEDSWPDQGLQLLSELGFKTAALALSDDSVSLDDPVLKTHEKLALVLGTEGDGLSQRTIAACDYTVRIPMAHGVDSLNVAAASAVAFWELRAR